MTVTIRPLTPADRDAWIAMRTDLWPHAAADHPRDVDDFLAGRTSLPLAVLVATDSERPVGFAELSLRAYAEGCETSPVAYLEGWYVSPAARGRGVGRALIDAFAGWARERGCAEIASDTEIENETSARAHLALDFEDAGTIRCFRRDLRARPDR